MPYLVRAVMPYSTGLPRDVVINDFAIDDPLSSPGIFTALRQFYNDAPGDPGEGMGRLMSKALNRATNACTFQVYEVNLATGAIGEPLVLEPWTLTPSIGAAVEDLPHEVALCTSIEAEPAGGVARGRRRGRLYLGPWNSAAMGDGRPNVSLVGLVAERTETLVGALEGLGATLNVWSRMDGVFRPVVQGWVDDAWDTQRRRGLDATARTVWPSEIVP